MKYFTTKTYLGGSAKGNGGKITGGLQVPGSKSWTHKCKGQWKKKMNGEKRKHWPPNTGQQKLDT